MRLRVFSAHHVPFRTALCCFDRCLSVSLVCCNVFDVRSVLTSSTSDSLPSRVAESQGTNMSVEMKEIIEGGATGFYAPASIPLATVAAKWFVLHVKSRQEKALAGDLAKAGIEHYLPLNRVVRYHGNRKAHVIEPLFSGYLFSKGNARKHLPRIERVGWLRSSMSRIKIGLKRNWPSCASRSKKLGFSRRRHS